MHIDEFRAAQRECASSALSALFSACRRKFLNAARLMELRGPMVEQVREIGNSTVSLWPLMTMYGVACERYCETFFSPQADIFPDPGDTQDVRWGKYFHHVLLPDLLTDDAFVRNVLRAMRAVPCQSPQGAGEALVQHVTEMTLPLTTPLWAPEDQIDL